MNPLREPELYCCVHGCSSRLSFKSLGKIKLFPFPDRDYSQGLALFSKWVNAVKLPKTYSRRMRVCSLHFQQEDFSSQGSILDLKPDAVPSLHLPRVWRNKFYAREYGKMIKLIEYRGIGKLRLCHESKLSRKLRRLQLQATKRRLKKKRLYKRKEEKSSNSVPLPIVSSSFSLVSGKEVFNETSTLPGNITIKEEPPSDDEVEITSYSFSGNGSRNMEVGDTLEELLEKMNSGTDNNDEIADDEAGDEDEEEEEEEEYVNNYCNICGERVPEGGEHFCPDRPMEYQCGPCGKSFQTHRQLNAHNLSHFEYRVKKLTPEEQRLKDQQQRETTCKVCHKILSTKVTLSEHMLIHSGEKPHVCMLCDKAFRHKANLVQHVNTHVMVRNFRCKVCRQYFSTSQDLDKHVRKHRVVKKEFSCRECGQTFRTKAACWSHLSTHSKGRTNKGLECPVCGRILSTKATLKEHMFIHSGEKPFECLLCGKKIRHRANFIIHVQSHSLSAPHACNVCGLAFQKKLDLTNHISQRHTTDYPFDCIICGQKFKTEAKFFKHAVTHNASIEEDD